MHKIKKNYIVPKLRFPGFSDEWEEKKLGEISDVRDGTHDSPKYKKEGYPLITSKNLKKDGSIDFGEINLISTEDFNKINKRSKVDLGDILFGMIGTIGNPVIVKNDSFAIKNVALIKEKKGLNNSFLWQYLKSVYIKKQFYQKNAGGTQKFIALGVIRNLDIPIPSIKEQQKIATFLSTIDNWVENLRSQKQSLEAYKKGIMQKIFSQEVRFKDDAGKDFPEWEEKRLGEVFKSEKGYGLSKEKLSVNGKNKCILYGELYTTYPEVVTTIKSKTNETKGLLSKEGDLLIPCSTTTTGIDLANVTALNKIDILLGGDITVLRSNDKISNIFYAYYLSNYKKNEIAKYAQGVTIIHLYYNHFKNIIIDFPSFSEQQKIVNFLTSLDNLIELKQKQVTHAEKWKKGLMQEMFV